MGLLVLPNSPSLVFKAAILNVLSFKTTMLNNLVKGSHTVLDKFCYVNLQCEVCSSQKGLLKEHSSMTCLTFCVNWASLTYVLSK